MLRRSLWLMRQVFGRQTGIKHSQRGGSGNRIQFGVHLLEDRLVPTGITVYENTFQWGVGFPFSDKSLSLEQTVTADAPGAIGRYTWDFKLTNIDADVTEFGHSFWGVSIISVPVPEVLAPADMANDFGFLMNTDPFSQMWSYEDPGIITLEYRAVGETSPQVLPGQSITFSFTTLPSTISETGSFGGSIQAFGIGGSAALPGGPLPMVSVAAHENASELGSTPTTVTPGTIRVSRSGSTAASLDVNLDLGSYTGAGYATAGEDYEDNLPSSVTIPAGKSYVDITLTPLKDNVVEEGGEKVTLAVASGKGYYSAASLGILTIADDPPAVVSLSIVTEASEAQPENPYGVTNGVIRLTRTGSTAAALDVNLDLGSKTGAGYAVAGMDYENNLPTTVTIPAGLSDVEFTLTPLKDNLIEEDGEKVSLAVASGKGYVSDGGTSYLTIADDPPVVTADVEQNAHEAGNTPNTVTEGKFKFTRSGGDLSEELAIPITFLSVPLEHPAEIGADFEAETTVTFGEDSTEEWLVITPKKDNLVEGDEDGNEAVMIQLGGEGYVGAGEQVSMDLGDDPPVVTVAKIQDAVEYDAATSAPKPGIIRFSRTGGDKAEQLAVSFEDLLTGTAASGLDYTELPSSPIILANDVFTDVAISPSDDGLWEWEGPETVDVKLMASAHYVGGPIALTVTINEIGAPTLIPIVDDTISVADDYSLVGTAVNVGYQITGYGVLTHGKIVFSIESGPGQISGPTEVDFTTDADGKAYVTTQVIPTDAADVQVKALLRQNGGAPNNNPADKPLPGAKVAGVIISIASEGSSKDVQGALILDGKIRGKSTPAAMAADRITVRVNTEVSVYVQGNLPAGATLASRVTGQGQLQGTVASPNTQGQLVDISNPILLPALFPIPGRPGLSGVSIFIQGINQTAVPSGVPPVNHAGKLIFEVVDSGKPQKFAPISSLGFSVAAIPTKVTASIVDPSYNGKVFPQPPGSAVAYKVMFGQRYKLTVESDSGDATDLGEVDIKEVFGNKVDKPNPGYTIGVFAGLNVEQQVDYVPSLSPNLGDDMGRPWFGNAATEANAIATARTETVQDAVGTGGGTITFDQYFIFKERRTSTADVAIANSGFSHLYEVLDPALPAPGDFTKATLKITKKPAIVTIGMVKVAAGGSAAGADAAASIVITKP